MKRMMDVVISLILLLLFSPVMLFTACILRHNMGGPIIFKQQRPGLHGKIFYLYKFRTMHNGDLLPDQDRLTRLGKFLRKYSLDELPQLINVIKGEMSLVGPRPLLAEYLPLYTEDQLLRHNMRPGITGWAQVNGRNAITWEEKFELDIWYIENNTIRLDMKILFITIRKVLGKDGITHKGHVSMEKFNGSDEVV